MYTIGRERRAYTIEASDPEKGKKEGFHGGGVNFFLPAGSISESTASNTEQFSRVDQPSHRKIGQGCELCSGARLQPKLSYFLQGKTSEFRRKMGFINFCDVMVGPVLKFGKMWQRHMKCGF